MFTVTFRGLPRRVSPQLKALEEYEARATAAGVTTDVRVEVSPVRTDVYVKLANGRELFFQDAARAVLFLHVALEICEVCKKSAKAA